MGIDTFLSISMPLSILHINPVPNHFLHRFLNNSLSGKKGVLHSVLHLKQPFYFSPKLCLHKIVNMNIYKLNIQQKTVHAVAVAR